MFKLHIDAAKIDEKSVLFFVNGTLLQEIKGDIDIMSSIKKILEKNGLSPKDIEEFTYNTGPGSYTGLKVASSVANTFNWVLGKKGIRDMEMPDYGSEPNITKPKKPQTIK